MGRVLIAAVTVVLLSGCGDEQPAQDPQPPQPPTVCAAPDRLVGEACVPAGVSDQGVPAGIPPGSCADGFEHDGDVGCAAVLPTEPCTGAEMALPGETTCRKVMPCGTGTWGDLPVDATTQYVDQGYVGNDSDGSESKPWLTIVSAYGAAAAGDLIVVAEGTYAERVIINKPVRLWGVCPEKVTVVGNGFPAIHVRSGADGTVIGGVALTSATSYGLTVSGSPMTLERAWVHSSVRGIDVDPFYGPGDLMVDGALIEENDVVGIGVVGGQLTLRNSVVRANASLTAGGGIGIYVTVPCTTEGCQTDQRSTAHVEGSVIRDNMEAGVVVAGSDLSMEASVIRDTRARVTDAAGGHGLAVQLVCDAAVCDPAARSSASVTSSVIERNSTTGVVVIGSTLAMTTTVVRDTAPVNGRLGRGVSAEMGCAQPSPAICQGGVASILTLEASLVERNHDVGVLLVGGSATIDRVVVRDVLDNEQGIPFGRGVNIEGCHRVCEPTAPAEAALNASVIERAVEFGLTVTRATATAHAIVVRSIAPRSADGAYGDGVVVASQPEPATLALTHSAIEDNARAGLSVFGASASLASVAIGCAAFELAAEAYEGIPFVFDDQGGNVCGCPVPEQICKAESVGLAPPEPLAP